MIEYDLWKERRARMAELAVKRDKVQHEHDAKAVCRKCGHRFVVHARCMRNYLVEEFMPVISIEAICCCRCAAKGIF